MSEFTITSPHVDSNTCTMGIGQPFARVDLNPMPELTLSPSQELRIWPLGVGVVVRLELEDVTSPRSHGPFYSRLLDKYLKTT
jgi:hypothetical protein